MLVFLCRLIGISLIIIGIAALLASCGMIASASAAEWYAGINALGTLPTNTDQDELEARNAVSPGVSAVIGAAVRPWLRAEAELGWRIDQIHGYGEESADGDVHTVPLLANVWLQIPREICVGLCIVPYAGGGAGAAWQQVDGSNGSQTGRATKNDGIEFAWQAGGGVRVPVAERLDLDVGYRWFEAGEAGQHTVLLGLSYRFGG